MKDKIVLLLTILIGTIFANEVSWLYKELIQKRTIGIIKSRGPFIFEKEVWACYRHYNLEKGHANFVKRMEVRR